MAAFLISQRIATLWELQNIYSLEDLYYMHECAYVPLENENIAAEKASHK